MHSADDLVLCLGDINDMSVQILMVLMGWMEERL